MGDDGQPRMIAWSQGEHDVLVERHRGRAKHGDEHDDTEHSNGELRVVAAVVSGVTVDSSETIPPWGYELGAKLQHRVRHRLVVAAALLIAEIDRLDRELELRRRGSPGDPATWPFLHKVSGEDRFVTIPGSAPVATKTPEPGSPLGETGATVAPGAFAPDAVWPMSDINDADVERFRAEWSKATAGVNAWQVPIIEPAPVRPPVDLATTTDARDFTAAFMTEFGPRDVTTEDMDAWFACAIAAGARGRTEALRTALRADVYKAPEQLLETVSRQTGVIADLLERLERQPRQRLLDLGDTPDEERAAVLGRLGYLLTREAAAVLTAMDDPTRYSLLKVALATAPDPLIQDELRTRAPGPYSWVVALPVAQRGIVLGFMLRAAIRAVKPDATEAEINAAVQKVLQ